MTTSSLVNAPDSSAPQHVLADVLTEQPFRFGGGRRERMSLAEAQRLAGEGLIRHVVADVYVACDVPDSVRLRVAAVGLLIPPKRQRDQSWVVGSASAAWLYTGRWPAPAGGVPVTTSPATSSATAGADSGPRLDVIIGVGRNRPLDPWIRGRQAQLGAAEIILVHGLPVSDPIRTATDVAREVPPDAAVGLLRHLEEFTDVTPGQVLHRLGTMRYARGAAKARAIVTTWQANDQ